MSRIYFSNVKSELETLLCNEKITVSSGFIEYLLKFMSKACTYEEEEKKIRPHIILGCNLNSYFEQVPSIHVIPVKKGDISGKDLERILKPLLPFCNNGWCVYVDIHKESIQYGLQRNFSGPRGLSSTEVLFETNGVQETDVTEGLIEIRALSTYELEINGLRKSSMTIDFSLTCQDNVAQINIYDLIADDIVSSVLDVNDQKILSKVFVKFLKMASQRIHGTILLIVDADCSAVTSFLADGIWFTDPIDLSQKALNAVGNLKDGLATEEYYALSGLLLEMMNVDGITVIDNLGRIRGYNIFINPTTVMNVEISGGARKRAADALIKQTDRQFIGVYFQSQDGHSFYKRVNSNE